MRVKFLIPALIFSMCFLNAKAQVIAVDSQGSPVGVFLERLSVTGRNNGDTHILRSRANFLR